ncbi:integral membrane protein [Streptomyces viridochromogenes DSM 40736]|uniref:Integral membrane protein n=1 Tax=Streptomyces viridochromogenes (strain DSM 40736 / JCM 4977 / BCRC 1201 / Tue 494) TaxID=591159 RepID=D9XCX3_STRVT|nr:DUF6542 domain-containing protein [Streptomyces viridochromogenes]EFL34609.1 integral membrane protein [Streptomyces viridochromogenes DSM 40736]
MERYRTRPAQYGPRRDRPGSSLPPQMGRGAADGAVRRPKQQRRTGAVRRPVPESAPAAGSMPNPRLTGLGSGLFCAVVMFLLGGVCALLFGASLTAYGVLFLPVCVLTAMWVRRGDLMTAPVVVPIAFVVGLLPVADSDGGVAGRLMGLVTALATQAVWLYGGTLIAGLIVIARRIRLVRLRRAAGARPPV